VRALSVQTIRSGIPTAATQKLYDDLVAKGSASRAAAIEVGVTIEKTDIADLKTAIAQTDEAILDRVYGSLLAASQRHLTAFERNSPATRRRAAGRESRRRQGRRRERQRAGGWTAGRHSGMGQHRRRDACTAPGACRRGSGARYGAPA
jgi:hypothetical protein